MYFDGLNNCNVRSGLARRTVKPNTVPRSVYLAITTSFDSRYLYMIHSGEPENTAYTSMSVMLIQW